MTSIAESLPDSQAIILFLAANPVTSGRLSLDEEVRDIEERIQTSSCRVRLALRTRWAVRPDDVLAALNQDRPVVVHFSGHGSGSCGLVLHDEDGRAAMVSGRALKRVFTALKDDIRVVVLNACYSEEQARFIAETIDCVIGMTGSIGDRAARTFAGAFYRALGHGRHVQNAFDQGLAAIDLESLGEENAPCLLVRDGVAASSVFLRPMPQGDSSQLPVSSAVNESKQRRVVIILEGTPQQISPEILARLTEALREFSGDWTAKIETISDGSIRLIVALSEMGERRLLEASKQGKLTQLAGFEVVSIAEESAARQGVARAATATAAIQEATQSDSAAYRASLAAGGAALDIGWLSAPASSIAERSEPDSDIQSLAKEGETKKALELLMKRHGQAVYTYCRTFLHDASLADDVHQKTFIEAYSHMHRFAGRSFTRSWLLAIAHRHVLEARKAHRRRVHVHIDDIEIVDPSSSASQHIDLLMRLGLEACIEKLDDRTRSIFLLRFQQGLSIEEIAAMYGERPSTVRGHLARTQSALRHCVEKRTGHSLDDAPNKKG